MSGQDIALEFRGVQPFGICGPHWKKKSCFGSHIKYTDTNKKELSKKKRVLNKFTVLCWVAFIAILGRRQPASCGLDTPARCFD